MANNNFFLNQDPLLFQSQYPKFNDNEEILRKQLNDSMLQYKMYQDQPNIAQNDYVGDLDKKMKTLSESVTEKLLGNSEYVRLNNELTSIVQQELMSSIKWRINNNQNAIKNIERQEELIDETIKSNDEEQRRSLNEINDYVKNYSNITFDEYKKIKSGIKVNNKTEKSK